MKLKNLPAATATGAIREIEESTGLDQRFGESKFIEELQTKTYRQQRLVQLVLFDRR